MGKENLQRLMEEAPRGQPLDPEMLRDMRISPRSTSYLLSSGWLQRLSKGAYLLRGDTPTPKGILSFISRKIPGIHIGGRTALVSNTSATLPASEPIMLWGPRAYQFPPWIAEHLNYTYQTTDLFDETLPYEQGLNATSDDPGVFVSIPERALLELASDTGKTLTVEEAQRCMAMVSELRESVLDQFLLHCTRVKVIKLVCELGRLADHAWVGVARQHVYRLGAEKRWSYVSKDGRRLTLK